MTRSVVSATVLSAIGVVILVSLGVWQLERLAWKQKLIADLTTRLVEPPRALPASLTQEHDEFRLVRLSAQFLLGEQALVYTAGSALRPDVTGPGYWVLSPARTAIGVVVVNRGFVADKSKALPAPAGAVELTGALRWPDENSLFTPADEPQNNLFYRRDPAAIAKAKNWGAVAPFYVEQESPQQPGGPKTGQLVVKLPNNHLQYAITWFGLALALAAVYVIWLRGGRRA